MIHFLNLYFQNNLAPIATNAIPKTTPLIVKYSVPDFSNLIICIASSPRILKGSVADKSIFSIASFVLLSLDDESFHDLIPSYLAKAAVGII